MKKKLPVTIVGGRPPEDNNRNSNLPLGIEVLLKKASVDKAFERILLDKKAEAAAEIDLELNDIEKNIINSIPQEQIQLMISKVKIPDRERNVFLGRVAAAMIAITTSTLLSSNSCENSELKRPDTDASASISSTASPLTSASPTASPTNASPSPITTLPPAPTGIRPDIPPVTRGISPR